MADFRHSTPAPSANPPHRNRRAFLTVSIASIAVVSIAPPAIASALPATSADFHAADRAFVAADTAMNEFGNVEHDRAYRAWEKWRALWEATQATGEQPLAMEAASADFDRADALYDELFEIRSETMARLISTPAPDANAVARKLDILIAEDAWDCNYWDESIGRVLADLRRLGSAA